MSETQLTRCPGCATVYRVTEAQLALREGQVRCGHCRAVFDATTHRVELAPAVSVPDSISPPVPAPVAVPIPVPASAPVEAASDPAPPDAASEPALVDAAPDPAPLEGAPEPPRDAIPVSSPEATPDEGADGSPVARGDGVSDAQADEARAPPLDEARALPPDTEAEPLPDAAALEAARAALRPRKRRTRSGSAFYAVAAAVLAAALVVQSAALFRDSIVARVPQAAPALATLCSAVPCRTGPRRDAGALSIEGSDLEADPAHRGLLVLTATLRNREASPVAWPDIELSLTDSSDRTVVRRVLAPTDYLPANADRIGLDAHSERQIRLFVDASATRQAGYRLYLFYP